MFQVGPIMLGQYRPLDSYLHRLDARSKVIPITLVLILSLFADSILFYLAILAALVIALLLSGVRPSVLAANLRAVLILVLITTIYHLLFSARESAVVFEFHWLKITEGAIQSAAFFSARLVLFISVAFLVTLTSSPSDLAEAFVKLLKPLAWLKVPIQDLAMIIFIAIRFIPILYEEFKAIRNAQIMRGVDFDGSIVSRLRKSVVIVIPVFVSALQRADDLALAIESRGYRARPNRTMYSQSRFGAQEWLFAAGTSALIILLFRVLP